MSKYYPEMDDDVQDAGSGAMSGTRNAHWTSTMSQFFKSDQIAAKQEEKTDDAVIKGKKHHKKKQAHKTKDKVSRERYATLDFLKCLENTLCVSLGASLAHFAHDLQAAPCIQ